VRDLFRHLSDVRRLRANPVVKGFFGEQPDRKIDQISLATICSRILEVAGLIAAEDEAVGRRLRARRQLQIIEGLCSKESAGSIAFRLGLSRSQFYRERRSICSRVAHLVQRAHDGA
jgi:hypothetical protein